ncbi:hypothetical protein HYPSUDRAFT_128152 [Hypholoma sublateritium FD-334 SS-4]|uniref:Arrestin-like N-terminal domain-containing protein n=1 Tax=Hypholoma sublateritium (strain FD-334 SS-4) TaxID=945553 RepID=A0A0D2PKR8_HYPSF|nr:hypothetical protein HYPSUDRAFT_128152 [Hypholoma sublateritium FD-334 SS-4]
MATSVLPGYSPRGPSTEAGAAPRPPTYSLQPTEDEETVAITPRAGVTNPQGHFIRAWPQATLILRDQDPQARLPTYGRGGRIVGELGLTNPDKIVRVTIKLTGQMSLSVADSGSTCATLCSIMHVLWKNPHETQNSAAEPKCPSILPIHIQFPQFYTSEGRAWRLPPTFEATFLGVPALFVRCMYTVAITITRTRSYHLASWTTNKTYLTMVTFRPRTRPNRPIVLLDTVFASIKPVPEEWLQIVSTMNVRQKPRCVDVKPIECHLFIPSIQTFALTDTIPFHITLCSSIRSLRELLPADCPLLQTDNRNKVMSKAEEFRLLVADAPIRVTIARQVVVDVNGRRRLRTFPCAIGKLWPVPPHAPPPGADHSASAGSGNAYLDWQGEIKPWGEVTSGGFSTSNLVVKDFLVLALAPPNPRTSSLMPLQLSHPIRLVTDSWIDTDVLHPGDR